MTTKIELSNGKLARGFLSALMVTILGGGGTWLTNLWGQLQENNLKVTRIEERLVAMEKRLERMDNKLDRAAERKWPDQARAN